MDLARVRVHLGTAHTVYVRTYVYVPWMINVAEVDLFLLEAVITLVSQGGPELPEVCNLWEDVHLHPLLDEHGIRVDVMSAKKKGGLFLKQ